MSSTHGSGLRSSTHGSVHHPSVRETQTALARVRRVGSELSACNCESAPWGAVAADDRPHLLALAGRLRELRQRAGVSQAALAARAGLATSTVERIEGGQRRTRRPTLAVLLDALNVVSPDLGDREHLLGELVALAGPALAAEREPRWAARCDRRRERRRSWEDHWQDCRRLRAEHPNVSAPGAAKALLDLATAVSRCDWSERGMARMSMLLDRMGTVDADCWAHWDARADRRRWPPGYLDVEDED